MNRRKHTLVRLPAGLEAPTLYRVSLFQGFGASATYLVAGMVTGMVALVLAVALFPIFPIIARLTTRLETRRIMLMGVVPPAAPRRQKSPRWIWELNQVPATDLLGWATAVGYGLITAFVAGLAGNLVYFGVALMLGNYGLAPGLTLIILAITIALLAVQIIAPTQLAATARLAAPEMTQSERIQELTDSRRAIVEAFEIERRRIERDLHDGAQQFLVAANMKMGEANLILQMAQSQPSEQDLADITALLDQAQDETDRAMAALRETVTGLHPKLLSDKGLEAAVKDIAMRCPVPVEVRVPHALPDLPDGIRSAAYFLINEALTNIVKYAPDAAATVLITASTHLRISIVDTGEGGAELTPGHGLDGLRQRLGAFGGTLTVSSPAGGPTVIQAVIPLLLEAGESSIVELTSQTQKDTE
ncbi:MAG: histidine kinase [Actinomycetaceae bacterium]|nr:histidine kinase [Actinomycetaceae bacterium]